MPVACPNEADELLFSAVVTGIDGWLTVGNRGWYKDIWNGPLAGRASGGLELPCDGSSMARMTLQVLDGMERGRIYTDLLTPFTIGREEDNDVQLNDDRVSRCHAKVQDDGGRIILTDLGSTNGTRVNGHVVHMHVLQTGDLILIGRCLLLIGAATATPRGPGISDSTFLPGDDPAVEAGESDEFEVEFSPVAPDLPLMPLFPRQLPELPENLRPVQLAQLTDMLGDLHSRLGIVLQLAVEARHPDGTTAIELDPVAWRHLLESHAALATYLRDLTEPG